MKIKKTICYGDSEVFSDDTLIKMREDLMDYLEKNKTDFYIQKLHELMEVERELTLREEYPY
jgi:hypothetical protein